MAVVGVSVAPVGTENPSISHYVAECERVLEKYKDLKHKLTPMATVIEGDLDTIFKAVKEMHKAPFRLGAKRVLTHLAIDERIDKNLTMEGKIEAVEKKRGK